MASEPPPRPNIDAGRVLGRGFSALGQNFLPFLAAALVLVGLPAFIGQYIFLSAMQDQNLEAIFSFDYWGGLLASGFGSILGNALLQGVLVRSTILHLGGRERDLTGSLMAGLRLLLPIVGVSICVGILFVGGLILLIVPGIIVYCMLIVAVPVLVEERAGVFGSIARSRELTRGSRGQIFLLAFLFWIFSMVIGTVVTTISGTAAWSGSIFPDPLVGGIGSALAASLTGLISTVVIAALYVELRQVKEGADTDQLAEVFG